ncbi:hypothetical protein TKK_0010009 [Trichogramma kaykai]
MWDEMMIKPGLEFSSKYDILEGYEDLGSDVGGRSPKIATHVLVFMLGGLIRNWKQPFFYIPSAGPVSASNLIILINKVLELAFEVGFIIKHMVCDQSKGNQSAAEQLGITLENPSYTFNENKRSSAIDAARRAIKQRTAKANQRAFSARNGELTTTVIRPQARAALLHRRLPKPADDENPPAQSQSLEAAQDLLCDIISKLRIDVAILCEQYKKEPRSTQRMARRCQRPSSYLGARRNPDPGAPGKSSSLLLIEFSALLANITEEARGKRPLVNAGDFNTWSTEWGCRATRPRAPILLDSLALLDAVLLNNRDVPTFNGLQGSSVVDLTFVSESLAPRVLSWTVSRWYTHSNHQAVVFEIEDARNPTRPSTRQSCRWNARALDADRFSAVVSGASVAPGTAEDMASSLMDVITSACHASMTKANLRCRREPVYWWTAEIADLRRSCLRARRLFQRLRGQQDEEAHSANYASARRLLRVAIVQVMSG